MSNAYKKAGVDIELADSIIKKIKPLIHTTHIPGVMGEIGHFAGLFSLSQENISEPVLVSGTDGVGTKLKIAHLMKKHNTIGIDLVAMCVNDILTCGARPLFFLDYLATGKLKEEEMVSVIEGIVHGCKISGCALLGGETAEMPGFYGEGEYDLAGFAVGIVGKKEIITGQEITPGDMLIGLPSSGLHSNGYSLVRKVFTEEEMLSQVDSKLNSKNCLGEELLKPTRIYVPIILPLLKEFKIKGIVHITGGGFLENIPRVLPESAAVNIFKDSWPVHPIFNLIADKEQISAADMFHTFNMGIGLVLIVSKKEGNILMTRLGEFGEKAYEIGEVIARAEGDKYINI